MKILKMAPRAIAKPKVIVRPPTEETLSAARAELEKNPGSSFLYVRIVKGDAGYTAIDNFEVLEAAKGLKLATLNVIDMGRGDPLLRHVMSESRRDDINPARLALAVREMAGEKPVREVVKQISMNRTLNSIIQMDLPDKTWQEAAKCIDDVFNQGVSASPPPTFFDVLAKLGPKSEEFLEKVKVNCKASHARHFNWPDRHLAKFMMTGAREKKVGESITRGVSRFECPCGREYGVINGVVHKLRVEQGCSVADEETGTNMFLIPGKDMAYIGDADDAKPRFTRHKAAAKQGRSAQVKDVLSMMDKDEKFLIVRSSKPRKNKKGG